MPQSAECDLGRVSQCAEAIERTVVGDAGTLVLSYDDVGPRLLGRPVVVSDVCAVVGTTGDILLLDPQSIISISKASGPKVEISAHPFGFG